MTVVRRSDPSYPAPLLELHDPPERLYLRPPGDASRLVDLVRPPLVAVVGARRASAAGSAFTRRLAAELAAAGVGVVSGLALGIDAAAHEGALDGGGRTVAVLGCGPDRDYPRRNAALAARIAHQGTVLSEYAPGTPPAPWRFPARNRIVAALATVVVVVEASARSGALITAAVALDLGREVLAVPGAPWQGTSAGANALLRDGAAPCTGAADVLAALGLDPGAVRRDDAALDGASARLLAVVRRAPGTAEALSARLGFSASIFAAALTELELLGLVAVERDGTIAPA